MRVREIYTTNYSPAQKSEIEKAVDLLNEISSRPNPTTGPFQPYNTVTSVKLYTATFPPQIEITHSRQVTDDEVLKSVRGFLNLNGWDFALRVGSSWTMNSSISKASSDSVSGSCRSQLPGSRAGKSEIEKAVDALNDHAAAVGSKVHTGLLQASDTMLSAKLYTATLPPQIEITHTGDFSDAQVVAAVKRFLENNGWSFAIRVGSRFAMTSDLC